MKVALLLLSASFAAARPSPSELYSPPDISSLNLEPDLPDSGAGAKDGAKITKLRYGPFKLPAMGMLDSKYAYFLEKPCTECYITAMQADIEYADGRRANTDEGAWLHHIVMYNGLGIFGGKRDLVCSQWFFPHRIFASGNERVPVRLNGKYKFGYAIDKGDNLHMLYDLVNLSDQEQTYYVSMTTPGYNSTRMVWMDVNGCRDSSVKAREGFYEYKSPIWRSTISGRMLQSIGHTHDGGIFTTVYINGKPACTSHQLYGTKKGYTESMAEMNMNKKKPGATGMRHDDSTVEHLTDTSACWDFGSIRIGDVLQVVATYNSTAHALNRAMGEGQGYADVMGLNPIYVGEGLQ